MGVETPRGDRIAWHFNEACTALLVWRYIPYQEHKTFIQQGVKHQMVRMYALA